MTTTYSIVPILFVPMYRIIVVHDNYIAVSMPITRSGFRRQSVARISIDRSPHCFGWSHSSSCRCSRYCCGLRTRRRVLPCSYSVFPFGVAVAVAVVFSSAIANTVRLLNPATDVLKRHTDRDGLRVTTPWSKSVFDFSPIDLISLSY